MYRNQQQRDFARELRNDATPAEKRLWQFLRAGKLGVKFRRQAAIGAYIVDFVCFSHCLVVELDGPQHVANCQDHDEAERLGSPRADSESFAFAINRSMTIYGVWWRRLSVPLGIAN